MTIGSVTGATQQFLSPADDDGSEGTFNSVSGRIAVLLLDTQENQKETDRQQLSEARRAFSAALDDEVAALREQADATFRGACFEGATVMASGGFEAWGALSESQKPWQKPAADGLARLAKPLGDFVGHNYGAADAKAAAGAEEAAKWQIDDARSSIKDAEAAQAKALDWVSSMLERDAATTATVLSNKA
jgi:hypothetical protein